MNIWPYVGRFFICCVGFLLFTLVMVWIFVCVDNYFEDKKKLPKATCRGCKFFCYDNAYIAYCLADIDDKTIKKFNRLNVRPCYKKKIEEEKDGKNH